jgi:hypothetical protein
MDYFVQWIEMAPTLPQIRGALDLIMYLLGQAALAGNWEAVLALGKGIERALILGGLWGAWVQVLSWMLKAARALGDQASTAWTLHQQGTRSLCLKDLSAAHESLTQALSIREALGDQAGAAVTRYSLELTIIPPPAPVESPASGLEAATGSGASSLLKVALLAGGAVLVAAGIFLGELSRPEQPFEDPTPIPQAPREEPFIAPAPLLDEKPISNETPGPTLTPEVEVIPPAPPECIYDLDFHGAADLGSVVQLSFDPVFNYSDDDIKLVFRQINDA